MKVLSIVVLTLITCFQVNHAARLQLLKKDRGLNSYTSSMKNTTTIETEPVQGLFVHAQTNEGGSSHSASSTSDSSTSTSTTVTETKTQTNYISGATSTTSSYTQTAQTTAAYPANVVVTTGVTQQANSGLVSSISGIAKNNKSKKQGPTYPTSKSKKSKSPATVPPKVPSYKSKKSTVYNACGKEGFWTDGKYDFEATSRTFLVRVGSPSFNIKWNMYDTPDQYIISCDGKVLYDTGLKIGLGYAIVNASSCKSNVVEATFIGTSGYDIFVFCGLTGAPSSRPSSAPSLSFAPSVTSIPSSAPSSAPSVSSVPSSAPSSVPSSAPSVSSVPSSAPSASSVPSSAPSSVPSSAPSISSAPSTSAMPSKKPSISSKPSASRRPSRKPSMMKDRCQSGCTVPTPAFRCLTPSEIPSSNSCPGKNHPCCVTTSGACSTKCGNSGNGGECGPGYTEFLSCIVK